MLLIDDHSRWMEVFLLKNMDQAVDAFVKYKVEVENFTGKSIKTLRSDRVGEFLARVFAEVCEQAGIKRQLTTPYTPQQNGVVERKNRTVMEMARSLLKSMSVPGRFWGEEFRHAVYLLNRLPTKILGDVTPYEAWTGRKPSLGHLKVFGCTTHAKNSAPHLKKLDDRSKAMVYFGAEVGSKAHRLFDPQTNRIVVSRDVVFEESMEWKWRSTLGSGDSVEFTIENEFDSSGLPTGGIVDDEENEQVAPTEIIQTDNSSGTLPDLQQSPISGSVQRGDQTEPAAAVLSTPHNSVSEENSSTPGTWSINQPLRFRDLNDLYENTEEVELQGSDVDLVDSDVEALLVEEGEPTYYREASNHQEWLDAMNMEMESIEKNNTWETG